MPLIIAIAILSALKYFEVSFLHSLSWWWIAALIAIAFIWFEFIERILGLDKRRAHDEMDKIRKNRVKQAFENTDKVKRR